MSFQDYVDHISQKYRLAVAISVIKTKPNNVSIEEYLTQLQNKIKDKDFDPNETVCSEDFNFNDDDILEENKEQNETDNKCDVLSQNRLDYSVNNDDIEGSQTILNDFVFGGRRLELNVEGDTSIGDTLRLLKEVNTITQEENNANQNLSQLTFCESQDAIEKATNEVTHCYNTTNALEDNKLTQTGNENCMDSQETQLYTLHGFTQDYSHVSQTQHEYFVLADKYIRNKDNSSNIQDNAVNISGHNNDMHMCVTDQNVLKITVDGRENIGKVYVPQQTEVGNTKQSEFVQNVKEFKHNNNSAFNDDKVIGKVNTKGHEIEIQNDQFVQNVKDFTDNIIGAFNDDKAIGQVTTNENEIEIQNVDDTRKLPFNVSNFTDKTNHNCTDEAARKETYNERFETNIGTIKKSTDNTPLISFNSQNTLTNEFAVRNEMLNIDTEHRNSNCKDDDNNKQIAQINKNSLNIENVQQEFNDNENDMEIDETASEENAQEKVPFKVIEELNRVKNFVSKKDKRYDGYSTDSGYRSDTQLRCSLKTSSQQHGTWLNQSAHCLFNYIVQAPATDDIVKQIAQVLGKLIDKLHEEENYPPFLEELLETVDSMLLDLRVGGGWAHDVLITKNDNIQRLLLLNKSKHILKYTIEKITNTLQELHINLTQEELHELTNIVEVENICYIFHILELLLKRYMKIKDISSQSTQNSQEDILPTRSSLTELWRKKWYPNSNKEVIKNENKPCILKRCSEILNKIIVECMDGYSLVSFAALQCFNLIQG